MKDRNLINNLSEEEKFLIFSYFMDEEKRENSQLIDERFIKKFGDNDIILDEYMKIKSQVLLTNQFTKHTINSKNKYKDNLGKPYNILLEKWTDLSLELHLNNSMEVANLFTYLLWNGYFSKDRNLCFQSNDRKNLYGYFSLDIINGIGVCLNFCDMLKDFLLKSCFDSAIILNFSPDNLRTTGIANKIIKRNISPLKNSKPSLIGSGITKKIGDHTCVLINDEEKIYIYDPTNLVCANITSFNHADIIGTKGSLELNPYYSYALATSKFETYVLGKLSDKNSFKTYSLEEINECWKKCISIFEDNINLIEDCYIDTTGEIMKISSELDKCKKKILKK